MGVVLPFSPAQAAAPAPSAATPAPSGLGTVGFVLAALAGIAIVFYVRGKITHDREMKELEATDGEAVRAQRELDAQREDLSLAHDWGTAHPLSLRYGQ
jgi:hypothetical protein